MKFQPTTVRLMIAFLLSQCCGAFLAHHGYCHLGKCYPRLKFESSSSHVYNMALGDFTVELEKPLGMILEEREEGGDGGGVIVKELVADGSAALSNTIVPGDILLKVNDVDVSKSDFDSVMDLLIDAPSNLQLTVGDGLGTMDMPKNVQKQLKTTEELFFVDSVVREAVRAIRRDGTLGDLLKVEVIVGAGVQEEDRAMVRFFAIFTMDTVSTYSCNVAATGVRKKTKNGDDNESIEILSLSCAKDEGLGRTFDLIVER